MYGQQGEVRLCTSVDCPLFTFRITTLKSGNDHIDRTSRDKIVLEGQG
jgi:hypothetical protein